MNGPQPTTPAAIFDAPGRPFRLERLPIPEPIGAETLVAVTACTLCGSDLHSVSGRRSVPVPTILGHEILGRVNAFGPDAPRVDAAGRPLAEGDRVTWAIVANCGACFYCLRDLPQKCERQVKYGHEPLEGRRALTGGLAGHALLAPGSALFRVPESLSDAVACPANCATATVAAALEAAGPIAGRSVLVLGAGMLGVTAVAWARSLGASAVFAVDRDSDRSSLALTFGAHASGSAVLPAAIAGTDGGRGFDVALELSGSPEAIEATLPALRVGGTLVLVGTVFPTRPIEVFPEQVVRRCLTLRGVHNYAPRHLGQAIDFLAGSSAPFEALVAGWRPLADLEAILAEGTPPGVLRVGVRPA